LLNPESDFSEIESIGPAPISTTTTTLSRTSSVETLNHSNQRNNYNNSTAEVQVDNIPKEKSKEGMLWFHYVLSASRKYVHFLPSSGSESE
jgi:hypothetical protein